MALPHKRLGRHLGIVALTIVAIAGILTTTLLAERAAQERRHQQIRLAALDRLGAIRAAIEGAIWRDVALVQGLVVEIATRPDIDDQAFGAFADGLLQQRTAISHLAAAREFVVTHVYPKGGNEGLLGLNYRAFPEQMGTIERALDQRAVVVAGPIDLVQGGRGFILRVPVVTQGPDEGLWGFVSAVIDYETLLAQSGLRDPALPIEVAIRGADSRGADGAVFFGSAEVFSRDAVRTDVDLPFGSWRLAAVPKNGWSASDHPFGLPMLLAVVASGAILAAAANWMRIGNARARNHEAVVRSEARFRSLFDNANDGIVIIDADSGKIADANARASELFGEPLKRLRSRAFSDFFADEAADGPAAPPSCEVDADLRGLQRRVLHRADGSRLPVEFSSTLLQDRDRSIWLAHIRDTSEHVRYEEELRRERLAAERANHLKSRFLANFSHEIRTPLNAIVGFSEVMCERMFGEIRPARYRSYVADIHRSGQHLLTVINDILDLSRIEAGELALHHEWTPLDRLVGDCRRMIEPLAENRSVALQTRLSSAEPSIYVDEVRLRQILINLLSNAVKFTDAGGRVTIGTTVRPDGALTLFVADTGIGMSDAELQDALRPFGQIASSKGREQVGSGLGLTLSKALAEIQEIGFDIDTAPGEGTVVRLALPARLVRSAAQEKEAPKAQGARARSGQ